MFKLVQKLKRCRILLKEWSKKKVVNNKIVIDSLMKEIVEIQDGINDENGMQKMEEVRGKLKEVWEKEEQY